MKYSSAVITCAVVLCASTTFAAPGASPETLGYLQRRGNAFKIAKVAEGAGEHYKSAAGSATGHKVLEANKNLAKEGGNQQGQKWMDEQRKKGDEQKRSVDDMMFAIREYLEQRGVPPAIVTANLKKFAASEASRKAAEKPSKVKH